MKLKLSQYSQSPTGKLLLIALLILLLLIPMSMVESIIAERSGLYRQASHEIRHSWGSSQRLSGPILTIPVMHSSDSRNWIYTTQYQHIKPDSATLDIRLDSQLRYRGIYEVPVYTAFIRISGQFSLDAISAVTQDEAYKLDEGLIQLAVGKARSLRKPIDFTWNDQQLGLQARKDEHSNQSVIFTASLPEVMLSAKTVHQFQIDMELTGSDALMFLPMARETVVNMQANWLNPSFSGRKLPANYEISEQGFTANWHINELFQELEHQSEEKLSMKWLKANAMSGVKLIQPVDTYQTVTRAAKYAILFLAMTFLTYFIIEILSKVSLHPIQYLLVGFANCIFYLLLLSLAEHIAFNLAYSLSAVCSILLITLYSLGIMNNRKKAGSLLFVLSALYIYLFVTLKSQDFALLFGSLGLFCTLAMIMYLTRKISWQRTDAEPTREQ